MRKKSIWIVILVILALLVAACGGAATEAPPAEEPPAAEPPTEEPMAEGMEMMWEDVDPSGQTVTFWHQHTRDREAQLQTIVADFNSNN